MVVKWNLVRRESTGMQWSTSSRIRKGKGCSLALMAVSSLRASIVEGGSLIYLRCYSGVDVPWG